MLFKYKIRYNLHNKILLHLFHIMIICLFPVQNDMSMRRKTQTSLGRLSGYEFSKTLSCNKVSNYSYKFKCSDKCFRKLFMMLLTNIVP